jgi:hypothetical protein
VIASGVLSCDNFEEVKAMSENPSELAKQWRASADALLKKNLEDTTGRALLKCANDLDFALKSNHRLAVGVAIFAGALLLNETMLPSQHEWKNSETLTRLAAPTDYNIPADHTKHEGGEETSVIVSSAAVSGENTASHTVSSSALLSFESLRRVERPFVFSGDDFDYTILNPVHQETTDPAKAEGDMQRKSDPENAPVPYIEST